MQASVQILKMEWSVWSVLFLALMTHTVCSVPVIHAPWGALRGISVQGDGGRKMNAYMGIAYAVPPVGERRFRKPEAHPGLEKGEVFEADKVMPACPQEPLLISQTRETSEDCLKLDVYVPVENDSTTSKPYAVMVFIHGGGLIMGDAYSYRPSKLVADGKVIVVVIQYRLGVLGFLTSGDDAVPGNMGLWDQNLAFRWVKHNIGAFGGDPERITLFGESAGSWSIGLHLVMPQSNGLFKRAIMQSGAPQGVVSFMETLDKKAVFKGLAALFDCQGDNSHQLAKCLQQQPVDHLINKSLAYEKTSPVFSYFLSVADGELVLRKPQELLQDADFMQEGVGDVDVIVGFNKYEGSLILITQAMAKLSSEALYSADFFRGILDLCFALTGLGNKTALKEASRFDVDFLYTLSFPCVCHSVCVCEFTTEFFYRGADSGSNVSQTLDPVVNLYGDCLMNVPITEWARYLAAAPHSAARYFYVLDHDFAFNKQSLVRGAHHADDLFLLFDLERDFPEDTANCVFNKTSLSEEEQALSATLVKTWTTFARTGNPSAPIGDDLGVEWPQFTTEEKEYLSISQSPRVVSKMGPYRDRLALWLSHLPQLDTLTSQEAADEPPTLTPREEL
ncbi:hypothetical protein ACOMHN_003287 [Nucella lapillus]